MKDIELPPASAFRTRNSENLPWAYGDADTDAPICKIRERLYTVEQMQAYARAAIEADRAQRVPDGWKLVPIEPTEEMLCAGDDVLREAFRDRCIATRTIYDAMLASTPAPAQQEPSEPWSIRMARLEIATEANMEAGAAHQEPPQQERKPMTHIKEQARSYQVARLAPTTGMVAISSAAYIELYERHHGIKE